MQPVLSVRNLRKVYRGKKPFVAVDGISFDLAPKEILGLLGPNGAGKTTTIQMLLSTLTYTEGSIFYFGKELNKHRSEILGQIAFASTYVSLPWKLTIAQNLNVFGRLYGLSGKVIQERVDPLLKRFGIYEKKHAAASELSAGQLTRLMLVKAFMVKPRVILLDEPTASLDPDVAHEVCQFILEVRETENVSILFTSHKMEEVAEVCDRVLFLQKGKIVADDVPDKLAKSVSKHRLQLILSDGLKRTASLAEKMGFTQRMENRWIEIQLNETDIAPFLTALAQANVVYSSIQILEPTLEDYFLKMVGKQG
ncbi:MAG: ABC transporter ATP-binding protein [Chlamydiia bacterium]|nr:ABC transporter ATP-binding protein [Chlamydiia bacterium]